MLADNWSNQLLAQPSSITGGEGDSEKRKLGSHGNRPGGWEPLYLLEKK
jgi:hypothetical protein